MVNRERPADPLSAIAAELRRCSDRRGEQGGWAASEAASGTAAVGDGDV